jgi:amino acid transporter
MRKSRRKPCVQASDNVDLITRIACAGLGILLTLVGLVEVTNGGVLIGWLLTLVGIAFIVLARKLNSFKLKFGPFEIDAKS